jgi:hypothetical protein
MRSSTLRRLSRLGAGRVTPEAIGAAVKALNRGDEPSGKAADLARYMRAFMLFAQAQNIGCGKLTAMVIDQTERGGTIRVQAGDLARAEEMLAEWHRRYGDGSRV